MSVKINKTDRIFIMTAVNIIVSMLAKTHGRIIDNDKKNCCAIISSEELDNIEYNSTTMSAVVANRLGLKPKELMHSLKLASQFLSTEHDDDNMTPPDFNDIDIITPN